MTKQLYLISLSGGGDDQKKLVDKETWDWINSPRPNFGDTNSFYELDTIPASTRERLVKQHDENKWEGDGDFDGVMVTTGSCENDRALAAPGIEIDGEEASFYSYKELRTFCKKHDVEIVDEFSGCIY